MKNLVRTLKVICSVFKLTSRSWLSIVLFFKLWKLELEYSIWMSRSHAQSCLQILANLLMMHQSLSPLLSLSRSKFKLNRNSHCIIHEVVADVLWSAQNDVFVVCDCAHRPEECVKMQLSSEFKKVVRNLCNNFWVSFTLA